MQINFFFRKPSDSFHSIEELFYAIQKNFTADVEYKNVYMPFHTGILGRIRNIFFVKNNFSDINHITGDINYIALGLTKTHTILTIHDIGSALNGNFLKKFLIKLFWFNLPLNRVEKITVVSEFSKNEIIKTFSVNPQKIFIIPDCVSNDFIFRQKKFNIDKPNILFIGTKQNKNLENAAIAVSKIKCKLIILGPLNTFQKNNLLNLKIDYENYCNLEHSKVVELYQNADILLFPSFYEGFGIPIIEAQTVGLPVVTSDLEPMKTIAGVAAVLVNPYKADEITDALNNIINNVQFRNNLIANGLENAKKYSARVIAKQYIDLYKTLS